MRYFDRFVTPEECYAYCVREYESGGCNYYTTGRARNEGRCELLTDCVWSTWHPFGYDRIGPCFKEPPREHTPCDGHPTYCTFDQDVLRHHPSWVLSYSTDPDSGCHRDVVYSNAWVEADDWDTWQIGDVLTEGDVEVQSTEVPRRP